MAACKSATSPVEGPGTSVVSQQNATQPVEAPNAGTATQPVEATGAGPELLLTGTGSATLHAEITGSNIEEELQSKPGSPIDGNIRDGSPDLTRDESADQELSEESKYIETISGVRTLMAWHQILEFDSVTSADDNPFAGSRVQPTGKVSVKLPVDDWLSRKMEKLNLTVAEGYPSRNTETAGLLVKTPRSSRWYDMHVDKKDCGRSTVCSWSSEPAKLNSAFYCEKYTYHFLTIAICWCHPTHWPTLRNVSRNLKRPVSECELACPPSGHVTTLVNNLHYFCWPS